MPSHWGLAAWAADGPTNCTTADARTIAVTVKTRRAPDLNMPILLLTRSLEVESPVNSVAIAGGRTDPHRPTPDCGDRWPDHHRRTGPGHRTEPDLERTDE
ncbi:hypothetical protein Cme02nite_55380 [Catellatospora methionotrophica]|uniref:Uncharacterized protein n=1 Tax=Catellatospora methionotrophica TaxID=121620 RepID=A0A8J3PGW4_9ACTN|nr:hypothetical protein Cme02nite_55380 [Catellatospora methionotrophica]